MGMPTDDSTSGTSGGHAGADTSSLDSDSATKPAAPASESGDDGARPEACEPEGALRCHEGNGRQVCANSLWLDAQACPGDEVCVEAGKCQPPDTAPPDTAQPDATPPDTVPPTASSLCMGQADQTVCDPSGALFRCDAAGTQTPLEQCTSVTHCEQGRARGACPQCLQGEYRCQGARLERCGSEGVFVLETECESANLCQVSAKACGTAVCQPNQFSCDSGKLKQCNASGDAFLSETPCSADLCDEAKGLCRVCTPNRARCDGATVMQCSADGTSEQPTPCSGQTPLCNEGLLGGECIGCRTNSDCTAMNDADACQRGVCDLFTRRCRAENAVGDPCKSGTNSGTCASDGHCGYCGDGTIDVGENCDPALTNDWHCNKTTCRVQGTETAFTSCSNNEQCSFEEVCFGQCVPGVIGVLNESIEGFCARKSAPPFRLAGVANEEMGIAVCLVLCSAPSGCPSNSHCPSNASNCVPK